MSAKNLAQLARRIFVGAISLGCIGSIVQARPLVHKTQTVAGFLEFPLKCSDANCSTKGVLNYTVQGPYTPGAMNSILDHNMKRNATKFYPYGDLADGGGNGKITVFDGETANGKPSGSDDTCIHGTVLVPLTNTSGCGKKYTSYDEHPGYDYRADYGTPVYAAAAGSVLNLSDEPCYIGNMGGTCEDWGAIGIDHGNGYISQYLHMSSVSVSAGDQVSAGEPIGLSGDTCYQCTVGPHLHFEVRAKGPSIGPESYPIVDPYGWTGSGSDSLYSASKIPPQNLWATTYSVLYRFTGGSDGALPAQRLVIDSIWNIYGTTIRGGTGSSGTVFKITPTGTETVLYSFAGGNDGNAPYGGVTTDAAGNLYGTTFQGGGNYCGGKGCGTVFELSPNKSGTYSEKIIYSFTGSSGDGFGPYGGVIADAAGNLYGTTGSGGANQLGTVFKVASDGTETILYSFQGGSDGWGSVAGVIFDSAGNLYGTTDLGGTGRLGTAYKLTPQRTETVLHSFVGGSDGASPLAELVIDSAGNLFGTTAQGGGSSNLCGGGCGTVFEVSPSGTETILHAFAANDGSVPQGGLIMDQEGNLYGTTSNGGGSGCFGGAGCGVVFELSPSGTETILHAFAGDSDGEEPSNLISDGFGAVYGTTFEGGTGCDQGCGTVFVLRP